MQNGAQLIDKSHDSERRRHLRRDVLFSSAELEHGNDGVILNISEGGVALHAFSEITSDDLADIRLQLSLEQPWIEVKGKVVWRSPSRKTVGVQFVDLASSARERIKTWMSDADNAAPSQTPSSEVAAASTRQDPLRPSLNAPTKTVPGTVSKQPRQNIRLEISGSNYDRAHKRTVFITLVGSMLLLAVGYFVWPEIAGRRSADGVKGARTPATVSPNSSDNFPAAAVNNARSPKAQAPPSGADGGNPSGFVLQVAAIKNENNAIALASQLAQKQFPAFVANSPGSDLYRVLVGPYSDSDTATKAQADLKREGFSSIRQQNTPAQ